MTVRTISKQNELVEVAIQMHDGSIITGRVLEGKSIQQTTDHFVLPDDNFLVVYDAVCKEKEIDTKVLILHKQYIIWLIPRPLSS